MGRVCAGLVALATALFVGLALPAKAAASSSTFAVLFSDPGDWIGQGQARLFHPGNGSVGLAGDASYLYVSVSGGTFGDNYTMIFAAAPGEELHQGVYLRAQRAPFRDPGRPGIEISGSGRGCNIIDGLFEVKDIAVTGNTVTRFWAVYEQHCEGGRPALYGEVRIGEPPSSDPVLAAPATVRWPAGDPGFHSTVVPVTVTALDAPVSLTHVAIVGGGASSFLITSDECTGRTLSIGELCQISVRFVPGQAGTKVALLRIDDMVRERDVELEGFAFGGATRVRMTSDSTTWDPGEYIGQGRPWSYTVGNSVIDAFNTYFGYRAVFFRVNAADGTWWSTAFAAAPGDTLTPRTYSDVTHFPSASGPSMTVFTNGRECTTLTGGFKVNSVAWWGDGSLHSASITFEQHCEGAAPALRGTYEFRAGDMTILPPWLGGPPTPPPPPAASALGGWGRR